MTDRKHPLPILRVLSLFMVLCIAAPPIALAQTAASGDDEDKPTEEVVVTGTRKAGSVPTETLSPVDVLGGDALSAQASFDLTEGIARLAPSFNTQRFPIADGTAFIRPVTLRNLSPDHTLVLINGTRRHRSALVNLQLAPLGTVNQGSQAVDFSTLPAAAIQRIEVLRDGASAQYGSDAIAGVVNVILKDNREGVSAYFQGGQYYEGDGDRITVGGNAGFPLTDTGFLSASFEYSGSDITSRGVARPDAAQVADIVGADLVPIGGLGQRWGDPDVEIWKGFANAGIEVSEDVDLYSHGSFARNETISDFFYRGPVLDPVHMFTARTTLQQDADEDFLPDPASQTLVDDIMAQGLNPDDYLTPDAGSPSGYVLRNPVHVRFPGGYNPNFGADITDWAWVLGAKGETRYDLSWDIRTRLAENKVEYVISETINPSLGRLSPDSFNPGNLIQEETSLNVDFVRPVEIEGLASPLNVAFGFEYREETYKIEAGDLGSRQAGPTAAVFGVGSDGFQGFPVESAGTFTQESYAPWLDVEADVTDIFAAGVAFRFENYEAFAADPRERGVLGSPGNSSFDWKVSARVDAHEQLALRGTANSGFRAPTPGQVNTLNVTTSADASGNLIPSGTYPVDHPVARALGATGLDPEDSISFTVGLVATPIQNTAVTVDFYRIEISDRLALQNNTIDSLDVPMLEMQGVENADLLVGSLASFFKNAYDSEVSGIDVAATGRFEIPTGYVTVDVRHNWNKHEVTRVEPGSINESRVFDLENQVPEHRTNLTVGYDSQNIFSGYVRASRYGKWQSTGGLFSPGDEDGDGLPDDRAEYGAQVLVDVEAKALINDRYEIAVGGENLFDQFPEDEQDFVLSEILGVRHSLTSPFGFNGGHWYGRVAVRF